LSRHTEGCFNRSGVNPSVAHATAPLSGAPESYHAVALDFSFTLVRGARLRRSPALPSLKGKVARERRKGFPRIQKDEFRRSMEIG